MGNQRRHVKSRQRHKPTQKITTSVYLVNNGQEQPQETCFSLTDLPSDILSDILSRLTTKSIFHYRCVCKKFNLITSDPYFTTTLLLKREKPTTLLLESSKGQFSFLELDKSRDYKNDNNHHVKFKNGFNLPIRHGNRRVVGLCNGFMCLGDIIEGRWGRSKIYLYICNPILKEYIPLPKLADRYNDGAYGFGYSPVTKEYKVIRMSKVGLYFSNVEIDIFTIGKDTAWRHVRPEEPIPSDVIYLTRTMYNLNGSLHWMGHKSLYAFDLEKEQMRSIPLPAYFKKYSSLDLQIFNHCLTMCCHSKGEWLDIWSMRKYGFKKSWTKLRMTKAYGLSYPEPVLSLPNSEILFRNKFFSPEFSSLFESYNLSTGLFEEFKFRDSHTMKFALEYAPSFESLKSILMEDDRSSMVKLLPRKVHRKKKSLKTKTKRYSIQLRARTSSSASYDSILIFRDCIVSMFILVVMFFISYNWKLL